MICTQPLFVTLIVLSGFSSCELSRAFAQEAGSPDSKSPPSRVEFPVASAKPENTARASLADPAPSREKAATGSPIPGPVSTTVEVFAREQSLREGIAVAHTITRDEVESSAGTWGDFSRYMQALPGVAWNNDFTNEIWVRGGDPSENLFVVDGIEVPNINHFALLGTTGGFASMITSSVIESVEMTPGNYDSSFSSRLSSLVDIRTREMPPGRTAVHQIDLGIAGAGGFVQRSLGPKGDFLLSAHRSILNLATDDIGINGVPIYTSGLAQGDWAFGSKDHLSVVNVSGADSIKITPQPCDPGVSSPIRTGYDGLRATTGFVWLHSPSSSASSTLSGSYSFQNQSIGQVWQFSPSANGSINNCPVESAPVYSEMTHDGIGMLTYRAAIQRGAWLYSAGATSQATNLAYQVAQPLGEQTPFSANPAWTDADNFNRRFTVGQFAEFANITGRLTSRLNVTAGIREDEFALTGAHFFSPRVSLALRLSEHQTVNIGASRSGQLAPAINILSYAQNAKLSPVQVNQFSLGAQVWNGDGVNFSLQAYEKQYSKEPVSTEYPSLMLANMIDTLGQQFVWLPLRTGGEGRAAGVEALFRAHATTRFRVLGSATYSRTVYAAADGIMRPGTFDFPLVANAIADVKLFGGVELSVRNSYATGRPYTPFDIAQSEAQSRGIYDLTKINAVRGPYYNRLDMDLNRNFRLWGGTLNVHAGVNNALNRRNFLGYVWLNSCLPSATATSCGWDPIAFTGIPEAEIDQMHLFPDFALRYVF